MTSTGPIEVAAFEAANSRAYLSAVFKAWGAGQCVMALPEGAGRKTVPGTKAIGRESFTPDTGWFDEKLPDCADDAHALIAFSSGTTGRPKAILIDHRALKDVVGRINTAMSVDETIREYLGVPVTYSFGFGRVRAVAAAGGKSFLPEHGFDPTEIGRMLAAGEINAVSAVPTLWRVLLANKGSISKASAQNLKWIEIGSQWMTGAEKLELRQLFPNAKIVQHYGLTEASRTTLLDISAAPEDRLDSVGQAVGETQIEIDAEGHIRTRGPHVATGLISGAGVKPVTDEAGWLTTSDRGRLDNGWLYYEGRMDELINSGGLKIDPTAFEQAVNSALGVPGAVAAGRIADELRGEKVLVALRQEAGLDHNTVTDAIRAEATRIGLVGNGSFELREVAELPLTATGKVKRAELAALPAIGTKAEAPTAAPPTNTSKSADLQALWAEILGLDDVPTDKSFYDLGGDSLSALTTIMRMESLGIEADVARGIFEGKTIAEMVGSDPEPAPEAPVPVTEHPHPSTPAPISGKAGELQALWAEILGLDEVPNDQSFYDLGGDSLSALTTIMRMESLGIEADVARGIFEGKTIAELAGDAGEPQNVITNAGAGKTGELQALWGEILGLEDVPTDKSFYDLGGDSLSALTTIMRMESLGIEADVARGIFEGKTIAEMAGQGAETAPAPPPAATQPAPSAPAASGKAGALQALWAEILGLDEVPTDQSFYDLGGDSLSALTTIMRMESLGIEADVARGIFEGKTIAELAGDEAPAAAPAAGGKAGELQALWAEILGLETVPTDKSFYDLGGDSLSALTTIMRMESLGIEADVARGIFEGKTIADLAGGAPEPVAAPATPPPPAPTEPSVTPDPLPAQGPALTLAEAVNSIHAARGVLVLWVVVVHWLPALLVRIDPALIELYRMATPAWRMGTPGFAMVFGMGVGALGLHHYMSNKDLFLKSSRFNTKLIVGGVLILALAKFFVAMAEGNLDDRIALSGIFYSAITFYALAMLTLPMIVWVLSRGENRLLTIFAVGAGSALLHIILHASLAHFQPPAALETVKLLLTAKYGYFRMLSFVMIGVAIGWLFRRHHAEPGIVKNLALYGLVLIVFGIVGTIQSETPVEVFGRTNLWHLAVYGGVVSLVLAGFALLNQAGGPKSIFPKQFNAFFIASGILALPIFVGHEIIFAIKQLFDAFFVPDVVSLVILLGLFFGGMFVAYRRLWRLLVG